MLLVKPSGFERDDTVSILRFLSGCHRHTRYSRLALVR